MNRAPVHLASGTRGLFRQTGSAYTHGLCLKDLNADVMASSPGDVRRLLLAWSDGDRGALEDLITVVYGELCRIAGGPGLVHEAYLKFG